MKKQVIKHIDSNIDRNHSTNIVVEDNPVVKTVKVAKKKK